MNSLRSCVLRYHSCWLLEVVRIVARYEKLDNEDMFDLYSYDEKTGCKRYFKVMLIFLLSLFVAFSAFLLYYFYIWHNAIYANPSFHEDYRPILASTNFSKPSLSNNGT